MIWIFGGYGYLFGGRLVDQLLILKRQYVQDNCILVMVL